MCRLALLSVLCLIAVQLCVRGIAAEISDDELLEPACEPQCGTGRCCYSIFRSMFSCADPFHELEDNQEVVAAEHCRKCELLESCVKTTKIYRSKCAEAPVKKGSRCYSPAFAVGCSCPGNMVCKLRSKRSFFGKCQEA